MKPATWQRGAAALLAAVCLAACSGPADAGSQIPEAPEYPWADSYDTTLAALDEAGTDYETAQDDTSASITMEGGELFGVPVDSVYLLYTGAGELQAVSGTVAGGNSDAMEQALRSALGDPVDSYCPATYSALSNFESYLSDDLAASGDLYWHNDRPLSETLPDVDGQSAADRWQQALEASGQTVDDEPAGTITVNGEERTLWHGREAMDQYLANNWEYVVYFGLLDGSSPRLTLNRVIWPF